MKFGIDRLIESVAIRQRLAGRRIALLAHPASVTAELTHSLDAVAALANIKLTAAFGPQHGLRGDKQDNMVESADFYDPVHRVPIFSLYGEVRRPTAAMMESFDLLLLDLQDIGCRIYTFVTTLRYVLEAAAAHKKIVWILDRPNPAGRPIEGLRLRQGWESFVGAGPLPMRHGLTLGELARWFVRTLRLNLDYEISEPDGAVGSADETMRVLLVAAKRDKIADYTNVITHAGRIPAIVDVDAFALQNAYEANYGFEAGRVVVLLNAGASAINVNILAGTQSVFTRDVSMGGNAFTEAVQKELSLSFETAEELKKGGHADAALYDDAKPVLRALTDSALLEVEKTFDFFKATAENVWIDCIVVSGGASRVEGFVEALEERFDTTVERFNPFRQITFDKRVDASPDEMAAVAAVAVGLALRRVGDR